MIGLGIVLLVVAETGRYGLAGALSATFALVNAVAAPVDRPAGRPARAAPGAAAGGARCTCVPVAFVVLVTLGAPTVDAGA